MNNECESRIRKGRRRFVASTAAAVLVPLAVAAQAPKRPHVVWIQSSRAEAPKRIRAVFASLGLVDGRDLTLSFENFPASPEEGEAYVRRIVREGPDAIVMVASPELDLMPRGIREIPVVFYNLAADPVGTGLVESLRRPGANITGTNLGWDEIRTRQWQMLKDFVPSLKRGGILGLPGSVEEALAAGQTKGIHPAQRSLADAQQLAATRLGFEIHPVPVRAGASEDEVVDAIRKARVEAVLVNVVPSAEILAALKRSRVPACGAAAQWVRRGLLMAVSFDFTEGEAHAVSIVTRILRGEHPSTIPIYRSTKYGMAVNRGTARVMGIAIPASILIQATEIVE